MALSEEALPDIGKDRPRPPERDVAAPVDICERGVCSVGPTKPRLPRIGRRVWSSDPTEMIFHELNSTGRRRVDYVQAVGCSTEA